ncbi:MAG: SDR family NAD(P)-dependent oxidoreductase [Oscillospiraceae bacterium]
MIALVTGASSGIGRDIARSLAKHGINVIITARRRDRLEKLKKELTETYGVKVHIIAADISDMAQCRELHRREEVQHRHFRKQRGLRRFMTTDTDLDRELAELDVNVKAFHTLFKLFLQDFRKRDYGYILNTASSAGFFPGPHFSSYYASKAYVVRMTQAVHEELRAARSHVSVSMLCPGPVNTEFMDKARVDFTVPPQSSEFVAEYAVRQMFAGQLTIVPSPVMKAGIILGRLVPDCILAHFAGLIQSRRERL